jgi:DNA primase
MAIPQDFIDELMTRVDIVEVIDARVPLKKAGREYVACCPFHGEKTPSFTVSPEKQFYHCFGCGAHGTALRFLLEYDRMDFREAVEELARGVGMVVPDGGRPGRPREPDLHGLLEKAAAYYRDQLQRHPQAPEARRYLAQRGLDDAVMERFGIGYAPPGWENLARALGGDDDSLARLVRSGMLVEKEDGRRYDRFRERVMFPIRDRRGRVVGFGGRALGDAKPKYLNSPETPLFHKGREVYGLHEAMQAYRKLPRLLVVEGYMDVVALAQHGIGYAVATLGTATTPDHLSRLFRLTPDLAFCFDGDRAGRAAAWRALETGLPFMVEGREVRFLLLPEGEDPDTLVRKEGAEAFEARLGRALPLSELFFETLSTGLDLTTVDARARLVEQARGPLARLPQGVFRQMMLQRLAELATLPADELSKLVDEGADAQGRTPGERPGRLPPVRQAQAQAPRRDRRASVRPRSLLHRALQMLLQEPALAAEVEDLGLLRKAQGEWTAVLVEMLELLHEKPHLNYAALLEHWRGTTTERVLSRLPMDGELLPQEHLPAEFRGAVRGLELEVLDQRLEAFVAGHEGALSGEAAEEYRALLRSRAELSRARG